MNEHQTMTKAAFFIAYPFDRHGSTIAAWCHQVGLILTSFLFLPELFPPAQLLLGNERGSMQHSDGSVTGGRGDLSVSTFGKLFVEEAARSLLAVV